MQTVSESWAKLEAWLSANLSEALDNLRPPATRAQIEDAEKSLSVIFPDAAKALYLLHDGENNNWPPGVFDEGHWFLPLSEMLLHDSVMSEFEVPESEGSFASWKSAIENHVIFVKGPVKPHIYSSRWIPITSSNGDVHRYIDFDPAPGGQAGQIIEHYPEACTHKVLASSLQAYLEDYVEQLSSGRFVIKDDCITDTWEESEQNWGIPDYLKKKNA